MKLKKGMLYLMLSTVASTPFMEASANSNSARATLTGVVNSTCEVKVADDNTGGALTMQTHGIPGWITVDDDQRVKLIITNNGGGYTLRTEVPEAWGNVPPQNDKESLLEFEVSTSSVGANNLEDKVSESAVTHTLAHAGEDILKVGLDIRAHTLLHPGNYSATVVVSCSA